MPVGGVCECALKLPRVWEGCVAIILHITGCQPDSGKPTVRDERGAYGNVGYGGIRHPLAIERARAGHSPPKAVRAVFLPDACRGLREWEVDPDHWARTAWLRLSL